MTTAPNTQAILLLTAPLRAGGPDPGAALITPGEYKRLAQLLRERGAQPADLLDPAASELRASCAPIVAPDRLQRLLDRGFQLSQALASWSARAIWVLSRADAAYPRRLKSRLREDAPPILYGCGDPSLLDAGGLAVVGSREADAAALAWTSSVGALAARARRMIVSGGARGVDQAAMRGALEADGRVSAVLADSLERAAVHRDNRDDLAARRLVLASPWDPSAGFSAGLAMQRNKLIYALSDACVIASSDLGKGGTWAGALEQLERLRFVPVFVRASGPPSPGLEALVARGARPWPEPRTPEALDGLLLEAASETLPPAPPGRDTSAQAAPASPPADPFGPAQALRAVVKQLVLPLLETPRKDVDVARALDVSTPQARAWLEQLVVEGLLEKPRGSSLYSLTRPALFA
jgi:DNA processing protein